MKKQNQSKMKQLLTKLKVLSQRGESGEREVAEIKMKEIMLKNALGKQTTSQKRIKTFKMADMIDSKTIMVHCIIDVDGSVEITENERKKELYARLTKEEYELVVDKFNHYYPYYIEQKNAFSKAFLIKNNLGINSKNTSNIEVSQEEIDRIINAYNIVEAKPYDIYEQISNEPLGI